MQTAVARQQAEGAPALVDVGGRGVFEAADIVAPEPKAGHADRQAAAQAFRHRFIVGVAVAAPVHRELLCAHRGGAREQHRFFLADGLFQYVPHQLVIDEGVVVVHFLRIGTIKPLHVGRDTLAEVGLEAVNAHRYQAFQLVGIPLAGLRISEVINRQARLPFIPLPQRTVRAFQQIAFLLQLFKHRRTLADIGVNPHADLQPFLFQALNHAFRVREGHRIPFKIAPLESLHPEAVKVEHVQRQVALRHAIDKAVNRRFIVVGSERGGQPQAERPGRRQCRTPGKPGIAVQHLFRGRAVDNEVLQVFTFDAELHLRDFLGADFERDALRMIHQHAVAAVGQIERDIFVRLFGAGAAVFVPGVDRLAVAHQRGKALAEAVNGVADAEIQALKHIVTMRFRILHVAIVFQLATGNPHAVAQEIQRPEVAFRDARGQIAALQLGILSAVVNLHLDVFQHVQRIVWAVVQRALEVLHAYADHPFLRREEAHGKERNVQLGGTLAHFARRDVDHHVVALLLNLVHLYGLDQIEPWLNKPVSITDFHE